MPTTAQFKYIIPQLLLLISLIIFSFSVSAEVISSDKHGFKIQTSQTSQTVDVNHQVAYQQFIRVNEWWNADHTWFGKAQGLIIEPKVGGCFCEVNGNVQALHMTVSFVEPNKEVRMVGGLGPLQMLGVHGGMSWKLEKITPTKTNIIFQYQVTGYMEEGLDQLAPIVDQVQTLQVEQLAKKLKLN